MTNKEKEVKAELLHCSFCGKSQDDVTIIIVSNLPVEAWICNECVWACNNIISDWVRKRTKKGIEGTNQV